MAANGYFKQNTDGTIDVVATEAEVVSVTASGNVTATGNLAVSGTTEFTGAVTATGGVLGNVTGNVTGICGGTVSNYIEDGAIALTDKLTYAATPCDALSLANGTIDGQIIYIKSQDGTADNLVVTPASFADGTTIRFDADNEWCQLIWYGSAWMVIATNATVA